MDSSSQSPVTSQSPSQQSPSQLPPAAAAAAAVPVAVKTPSPSPKTPPSRSRSTSPQAPPSSASPSPSPAVLPALPAPAESFLHNRALRPLSVQAQLELDKAMAFLSQVKSTCSADFYNEFKQTVMVYHQTDADRIDVIRSVCQLLQDHPKLLDGFKSYVPIWYKIKECVPRKPDQDQTSEDYEADDSVDGDSAGGSDGAEAVKGATSENKDKDGDKASSGIDNDNEQKRVAEAAGSGGEAVGDGTAGANGEKLPMVECASTAIVAVAESIDIIIPEKEGKTTPFAK